MSISAIIYVAMGVFLAWVLLEGTQTRNYRLLDWALLAFDVARIVVLWPLVLFVEKAEEWLKKEPAVVPAVVETQPAVLLNEPWQFENTFPIPTTGSAREEDPQAALA